jgi:hypothetical protein
MDPDKLEDDSVYTGTEVKALIEKLIEDIPSVYSAEPEYWKQQLRDKYL